MTGSVTMQLIIATAPTFGVAIIYCFWRRMYAAQLLREQTLRERVSYMLWVMAGEAP
jgi:hypothetical protein